MATWHYPGDESDTSFDDGAINSGWQPQNFCYGAAITLPAGTVTQLGVFADSTGAAGLSAKLGLYDSGGTLVVQGSLSVPTSSLRAWLTADVADTAISAGTYYVMGVGSADTFRYGYDSSGNGVYANVNYASSMASSTTISGPETGNRYGVRAEVEESSSANAPSVNDTLAAIEESVTMRMHLQNTASNDTVTLDDPVFIALSKLFPSAFDDVTVLDVPGEISNDLYPVASDNVLAEDAPAIGNPIVSMAVEAFDNVRVQDGQTDSDSLFPDVFDLVGLDDVPGLDFSLLRIPVFDLVTLDDSSPGVFAQGPLGAIGFDQVTVQEGVGRYLSLYINAFDNVTVIDGAWAPEAFSLVHLDEQVIVRLARLTMSTGDDVFITEDRDISGTSQNIGDAFDEVPINESWTVLLTTIRPSVFDLVGLDDQVFPSISTIDLAAYAYDDVTLVESREVQTNPIQIDEFTEVISQDVPFIVTSTLSINLGDDVTALDVPDMRLRPIQLSAYEDVSVNERTVPRLSKGGKRRTGLLTMGAGE